MTSSFLGTPKKCLQAEKPKVGPDPGFYEDGIQAYMRASSASCGNRAHHRELPRFLNKKEIDADLPYKGNLDRFNYTCIGDRNIAVPIAKQVGRDQVSYLREVSRQMRAKKAGIPPEFMHMFGKKGFLYESIEEKTMALQKKAGINTSSIRQRVKFLIDMSDGLLKNYTNQG